MLQQDYLVKMFIRFAAAIRKALEEHDPDIDTEASRFALEDAIGTAADIDADVLLALEPESVANILILGSLNDSVAEYIVHALMLDADYLEEDGYTDLARLRRQQAIAITEGFGFPYDRSRLDELLNPTGAKDERERCELEAQYGIKGDTAV